MKNFLIAIVLAVILVNCLGSVIDDWFGMHIVMSDELLSPWENLAALSRSLWLCTMHLLHSPAKACRH